MLNYEEFMEIKILFRQGKSIREISRLLHVSRNTVRRYLKQEEQLLIFFGITVSV